MDKPEKTEPVFTRLTPADRKLLAQLAKREHTTPSMMIRGLVEKHLERERSKRARAREAAKAVREHEAGAKAA